MVIFKGTAGREPGVNALATLMVLIVATGVVLARMQRQGGAVSVDATRERIGPGRLDAFAVPDVGTTVFRDVAVPAERGHQPGSGYPDYPIDARLAELVQRMAEGHNQYHAYARVPALVEQIALKLQRVWGGVDAPHEVTVLGPPRPFTPRFKLWLVRAISDRLRPAYDSIRPSCAPARCCIPMTPPVTPRLGSGAYAGYRPHAAGDRQFTAEPGMQLLQTADLDALATIVRDRIVWCWPTGVRAHGF